MERIASLSTGTKLMLAAATLLFVDLFLTWQSVPQRYGGKFNFNQSVDAWDGLGLLLGLLTLSVLALVILRETDVELSPEIPWSRITFGLAVAMLVVSVLKNLLDAHSAWASYVGIVLAAVVVVGAYLERDRVEPERDRPLSDTFKPSVRASAVSQTPTASDPTSQGTEPAQRW
jgi:hypothetical protein